MLHREVEKTIYDLIAGWNDRRYAVRIEDVIHDAIRDAVRDELKDRRKENGS